MYEFAFNGYHDTICEVIMEWEKYQKILLTEIIWISLQTLIVIACVVAIIVLLVHMYKHGKKKRNKKKRKKSTDYVEKSILWIALVLAVSGSIYGTHYLSNCLLDYHHDSYITYIGRCEQPDRDTLILCNADDKKLYGVAVSIPNSSEDIVVIYAKRSEIAVGVYTLEEYKEMKE